MSNNNNISLCRPEDSLPSGCCTNGTCKMVFCIFPGNIQSIVNSIHKVSEIDIAHRVHTKQIQRCSPNNLATGGSRAEGDCSSRETGFGLDPKVRPPPLIGVIPNDSFFRKLISVCTIFP